MDTNYEDKTDLQIECLISAEKWKVKCLSKQQWNNTAQRTYKEIQDGKCVYADARYCSNPSDAWPIIIENKISIQPTVDSWISGSSVFGTQVIDKNPLRAAMICFLKMSDAKND